MRIIVILVTILFSSACSTFDLKHFLNDFELLAQTEDNTPTLSVRVLKIKEQGECGSQTCPQEQLYIAVSEYGEYPEQNVFVSSQADVWEFSGWKTLPKLGEHPYKVVFDVTTKDGDRYFLQTITLDTKTIAYSERKEITNH